MARKKGKKTKAPSKKLLIALGIPTVFIPGLILAALLGVELGEKFGEFGEK